MLIDPQTSTSDQSSVIKNLAPELQRILAELQLHVGQRVNATVQQVVMLTEGERQQLLDMHSSAKPSPSQRALQTVLQDAGVKLVELAIKDRLIPALTNLSISRDAQVQVLVTQRGLLILPQPPVDQIRQPGETSLDSAPAPKTTTYSMGEAARGIAQSLRTAIRSGVLASQTGATENKLTVATSPANRAESVPPSTTTLAQRAAIASTLAQVLPSAQPLRPLLQKVEQVHQHLNSVPQLPSELSRLGQLLNNLRGIAIDLETFSPQQLESLQRAVSQSGVFYERQLVDQGKLPTQSLNRPIADVDPKGALIQLSQWTLSQPAPPSALLPTNAGQTILDELVAGLADIFTPRHKHRAEDANKQLTQAIQLLAKKSLAQVQLQQVRTLSSHIGEPTSPAQWHLDIPIKLMDTYGNLYLNIVEPRVAQKDGQAKDRKKKDREQKGRWKVFMQLELAQLGELAAEINVYNKTVEATLWAAQRELRDRANAHLRELKNDLEKQGMTVKDLRCSQNPPPEQKIRLDYALIDVKT